MRRMICFFIACLMLAAPCAASADGPVAEEDARAYILTDGTSGEVMCEYNADERLPIASVTKIMTMLLITERIDSGELSPDDMVTASENAMSYGGSTMFLEAGEKLSVDDMLKGIAVASANDGCVAMAEHIAGSESAFVELMNARAEELGMENTHFMNTNGLDEDNHYSSAEDVAIMSRELLSHPMITDYTTIWTDELRGGKFKLANTNKLIRFYDGATGLKTGSTTSALCCLSASATRDGTSLIAVVLGAPTSEKRFASARALLDFGFANYRTERLAEAGETICDVAVKNGKSAAVAAAAAKARAATIKKSDARAPERRVTIYEPVEAPVCEGDVLGKLEFVSGETVIDEVELVAAQDVGKKGIAEIISDIIRANLAAA